MIDTHPGALLLARSRPGHPLGHPTAIATIDGWIGLLGALLVRLWSVDPGDHPFPSLATVMRDREQQARRDADWEKRQHRDPTRGDTGLAMLADAAHAADELIERAGPCTLLHGDFLGKNIVSDSTSPLGWVVLDPIPVLGEREAEIGHVAAGQPAALVFPTARALAAELGLDRVRAERWAAVWTVHQAAQAWRADQRLIEELIDSDDFLRRLTGDPEPAG